MNRKTLIACAVALAVLAAIVVVAVFFLYSGTEDTKAASMASESKTGLLAAVPSDAVMVIEFSDMKTACSLLTDSAGCFHYFTGSPGPAPLMAFLEKHSADGLGALKSSRAVLSLHYNGALVPLLIIDAGRAGSSGEDVKTFAAEADSCGLSATVLDCSSIADSRSYLFRRDIILLSTSDVQTKSAERHIGKSVSILDSEGFAGCAEKAGAENTVLISCRQAGKFFTGIADRSVYGYADFMKNFSGWAAFSLREFTDSHLLAEGHFCYGDGVEDFANVFSKYSPSRSEVSKVIPSYTIFFASIPLENVSAYISAADDFADGTGRLGKIETARKLLQKQAGVAPLLWASTLDIKEVSAAFFRVGENIEKVLLMKIGSKDMGTVFSDADPSSAKEAAPKVCKYAYPGFASSVFGPFFTASDESFYTYIDGWIIVGSRPAIQEYADGRALENTLAGYMADASVQPDQLSSRTYFTCCLSVSEDKAALEQVFKPAFASSLSRMGDGYSYTPVLFSITRDKNDELVACAETFRIEVMKSKAPVFERDTTVVIPKGPFKVKNSGTGQMNLFYQQDNMYLCLKELGGKGIWGVPFSTPICGNAGTIDYFANGKLQILFASGSKLYLIDRLGRYVNPFPVDLGKEILIGPGIYDFNGTRKYNVMILHKDNTIEMYNLQGRRPAQWKTITSDQTIKGLPEAVKVAGKTYWIVRTSIQTLIFGFYGGDPLTVFEGDRMIRSDSKIIPGEGASVKAVCYDGKTHVIKLQ